MPVAWGGAVRSEPFVGREAELASLLDAWERARSGERRILLLVGEAGIGKTRLAGEIVARASEHGGAAHWGRAWESGGAPPLWPWIQLLRELLRSAAGEQFLCQRTPSTQMLREVIDARRSPQPDDGADLGSRFAMFDALAALLSQLSAAQPLVLVLDDLHAADATSLQLLHFLARLKDPAAVLIVATFRQAGIGAREPTSSLYDAIAREATVLELTGLDSPAVTRLARTVAPELPDRVVEDIHSVTAGNPLFVKELAQASRHGLADLQDRLHVGAGAWAHALRRRVAAAGDEVTELLAAASVLGRTFSRDLLVQLLDQSEDVVDRRLNKAVTARLVQAGDARGQYTFTHDLIRSALYEQLPIDQRRSRHLRAATLLEQHGRVADADLIAQHFTHAGKQWHERAARHLATSGEIALRRFAYDTAEERFRQALTLHETDDATRCDMLIALGTAQQRTGNPSGRDTLLEAATRAREIQAGNNLARALIALTSTAGNNPYLRVDDWIHRIEDALEHQPPDSAALRARLLASLLGQLWEPEDAARREQALAEALDTVRVTDDGVARAEVLYAAARGLYFRRDDRQPQFATELAEVASLLRRDPSIHVQLRARELAVHAQRLRTVFALEAGDLLEFHRAAAYVMRSAEELQQPIYLVAAECLRCAKDQMAGRMREIEERAAVLPKMLPEDMMAIVASFVETGWALYEQDRLSEVRTLFEDLLEGMPRLVGLRIFLALDAVQDGRVADARDLVAPLFADLSSLPFDAQWFSFVTGLVWLARDLEDVAVSRQLRAMLEPYADRHVVISFGHASCYLGSVELALGIAAVGCGDGAAASRHLERSLAEHDRLGATAWAARSQFELAAALARSGGDIARAKALVDSASARLAGTSMAQLLRQLEVLREQLCASPTAPDASLAREGDVWAVRHGSSEVRVKTMRGLEYLARLVAAPGQEIPAAALLSGDSAGAANAGGRVSHAASKYVLLDERAKREYRGRVTQLQDDIAAAEHGHDVERAAMLRSEMDVLLQELQRAAGLGGRPRTFSDADEKARVAVTKAIKRAVRAIGDHDPRIGEYLERTVSTGAFCAYRP